MGRVKKRKKSGTDPPGDPLEDDADTGSLRSMQSATSDAEKEKDTDKYLEYRVSDYTRSYPESGGNYEYIVFIESQNQVPIGDRDMMSLATNFKRYNKGVKQLIRINRHKVGVIFERPTFANAALINKKFLDNFKLKASIPASATEITGIIQHVPIDLSNEQIYSAISSSKNIISVKRFMRRTITGNKVTFEPLKTVSITFSCVSLPDSVDLNSWRFEVRPYIPPVKQCLQCLRYGHIAKFCKNRIRCSICGKDHSYKECTIAPTEATCCQCKGNHIAISAECPVKKAKIEENKNKIQKRSYADVLNEKSFPPLTSKNPAEQLKFLIQTDQIQNILIQTLLTLISQNRNKESSITNENIKKVLLATIQSDNNIKQS